VAHCFDEWLESNVVYARRTDAVLVMLIWFAALSG
jgi:hypothetical protein